MGLSFYTNFSKSTAHRVNEPLNVLVTRPGIQEDGLLAGNCATATTRVIFGVDDGFSPVLLEADLPSPQKKLAVKATVPLHAFPILYVVAPSALVGELRVADAIGVTGQTLDRYIAEVRGRSVLEEIIDYRFNRVSRLLPETALPVKTVILLAGFGNVENSVPHAHV